MLIGQTLAAIAFVIYHYFILSEKLAFWLIDISSSNSKFPWTTVYETSFEPHGKQGTYSDCDQK